MGKENMQNKKPMILVLAGPNGSGKSTITAFFDKVGKYTNADDVVATTGIILVIKTPTNVLKLNQTNFDNIHHNEYRRN